MFLAETKIYTNFQTSIPKEIRKRYGIDKNTVVKWFMDEKGEIRVKFREKKTIEDMEGIINLDHATNSVQLKKELYKWKKS